jgi:hypothetical protein
MKVILALKGVGGLQSRNTAWSLTRQYLQGIQVDKLHIETRSLMGVVWLSKNALQLIPHDDFHFKMFISYRVKQSPGSPMVGDRGI